jgi:SRSO17 transposase
LTDRQHRLLIRRSRSDSDLAFYRCWSPQPEALPTLVAVAYSRWSIESCFQRGKNEVGLDEHQVRRWDS